MRVLDAKFIKSAQSLSDSLAPDVSEIVFIGRSNVGKSSLLNSLTNRKKLAKSSQTPGKTKLINFFEITYRENEQDFKVRFVDLPGFGYAKVSKKEKEQWQRNLTTFLESRFSIRLFIQLIDSRHQNLEIDKLTDDFLNSIKRADQKIIKVFTKIDKLKQRELSQLKQESEDSSIFISNLKRRGIDELNQEIFNYIFIGDRA